MTASYIHSFWKSAPDDSPVEFFSELDPSRYETRKIEVFFAMGASDTLPRP